MRQPQVHLRAVHLRTGLYLRHGCDWLHQPGLHLFALHVRPGLLVRFSLGLTRFHGGHRPAPPVGARRELRRALRRPIC